MQYSLRSLLGILTATALLFGGLRWLGVSQTANVVVLVVLIAGGAAAVGLLAAISAAEEEDGEDGDRG
jgi:hypothetical protein